MDHGRPVGRGLAEVVELGDNRREHETFEWSLHAGLAFDVAMAAGCLSGRFDLGGLRESGGTGKPTVARPAPAVQPGAAEDEAKTAAPVVGEPGPFRFVNIQPGSGVDFTHVSGMTPEKLFPTANGSGVALFDYDGDGKLDLYFATGNTLPLSVPPAASNRLYRNLGGGKFHDETDRSGLGFRGYCHGITVGDIDNDGDPDVFLSNYGGDALFLNNGNGTFTEIGRAAGIWRPGTWSSSAAFLDYDSDGDLDLYVSRYGDWQYPRDAWFCGDVDRQIRRYCSPKQLPPVQHTLFRNNGDRTFTDVTVAAGLARADGHGFAAVAADLDGDGKTDLYVANDQDPRFLYLNNGNGTFRDVSEDSGAAYDIEGRTQAGMGVDAEDVDGDGRPELFVTNFDNEYNTLYRNLGKGYFVDATAGFGLAADSVPYISWGCAWPTWTMMAGPTPLWPTRRSTTTRNRSARRSATSSRRSCTTTKPASGSAWPIGVPAPTSRDATWDMAWPSATSTTTATSTS